MISRLKSLELHGYKTFAIRTLFEFPGDITAVVGPNGSGKSNISDAIRWVLGEQSFSLLRGRKTEDMIFSGSEQRPRASMANATITFNNDDGWLPIDFSEVSITRRAYRDGENEYLLNNQKVRLKEISELLSQSGLAQRTYTIIGQGLVDAALSLRPEERRRFFEEAAGIGLYRSRREEAINRLEATRRNMERVQDILSELEPRLQSLEKQARRAVEYDRIKADLQLLLREWYGYHWHESQQELKHAHEVQAAQETRMGTAQMHLEDVNSSINAQRNKITEQRTILNSWHAESAELHTQSEKISRNLAILDERQHSLQEQLLTLQGDLARLEEEQQDRLKRSQDLQEEYDHLEEELADAQSQGEKARKDLDVRSNERGRIEKTIREFRQQLVSYETQRAQLNAHLNELSSRAESLQKSKESLLRSIESESQIFSEAQKNLDQASEQKDRLESSYKQIENKIQDHRRLLAESENSLKQARDQKYTLEAEKARLLAQLDVLEQAEKSFSGLNQGARFILEGSKKGDLPGKFQALSSFLEVPPQYEAAIAASLGEYLDGVIFDTQTDLESTLVLLESGEKGRAVLLPSKSPAENQNPNLQSIYGHLGIAADLIKAPQEIQPILSLLLGQTYIVSDRITARKLVPMIPATARIVTLKGEIFLGSGVVIGGQDGRSGVVARPRQKRDLQSTLETIGNQLQVMDKELSRITKGLEKLQLQEKDLQSDLQKINNERSQVAQVFQKAALNLEHARQKSEFQKSQLGTLEKQLSQTLLDTKKTSSDIQEKDKDISTIQTEIRNQSRSLSAIPLEELQAEVAQWTTRLAVIERVRKEIKSRFEESRSSLSNIEKQQSSSGQRMEMISSTLKQLDTEKIGLQADETTLNASIEALRVKIVPAEQELQKFDLEFIQMQNNQASAQQAFTLAERYLTQAQLEVNRRREALDSLRRRVEDDFGLVAFEYKTDVLSPTPLPWEGMVEQLPVVKKISPEIEDAISRQRTQIRRMGAVNPDAKTEYDSVKERYDFLTKQMADLKQADSDLRTVIGELDELMKKEFSKTFNAVAAEFKQMFTRLFGGGTARLMLVDEENPTEGGVEIEARLPGRREQGLSLLSGGERSLTAVALIFSLLKVSPTPFCVLDEVDAMLDEANVGRFCDLLKELSLNTQFIVITHNRNTVQSSEVIYGVTMGQDSVSQIISLKLDEVSDEMVGRS